MCTRIRKHAHTHSRLRLGKGQAPVGSVWSLVIAELPNDLWPCDSQLSVVSLSQIGTGQKNRSINTTLNVRNSRISQITVTGFMNEHRGAALITWHPDEGNNNDDDNYHQQLKAKMAEWQSRARWASKLPRGMEYQPPLHIPPLAFSSPPLPPIPSPPTLGSHPFQPPGGTKLSGVRGTLQLDKMLQNDRDNNDNEFHVSQS